MVTSLGDGNLNILDEALIRLTKAADMATAANRAATFASVIGLPKLSIQMLITAIHELGNNILVYAGDGELCVQIVESNHQRGIRIIAKDQGPGIASIDEAMVDGFSSQPKFKSLGLGLGGVSRLMDDMTVETKMGQGTRVVANKWLRQVNQVSGRLAK